MDSFIRKGCFKEIPSNRSYVVKYESTSYKEDTSIAEHCKYTSLAATSLYTSPHDMEVFVQAHFEGTDKEPRGRGVLHETTIDEMKKPQAYQMGCCHLGFRYYVIRRESSK